MIRNRIDALQRGIGAACRAISPSRRTIGNVVVLVLITYLVVALCCAAGCNPQGSDEPKRGNPFVRQTQADSEEGCLLVLAIDLSGSFRDLMTRDGKAFDFVCAAVDHYMRQRIGTNDEIIIAQLSANNRPLLWQGTPAQLRADFDDAEKFREMLLKTSDPAGSRLYDGLHDVLTYVLMNQGFQSGRKRCVTLCLSDLDDTTANAAPAKARLMKSLKAYAAKGGHLGLYWVDQTLLIEWTRNLHEAGFSPVIVESTIRSMPPLPDFDD